MKVPPEHHPIFVEALPRDRRVQTMRMFGGVAASVNGHIFAGLFGRSTMLSLPEPDRAQALALEGAGRFDPMGDRRVRSQKVMLPEAMMDEPEELRRWIARAFESAALLPPKPPKRAKAAKPPRPPKPAPSTEPTVGAVRTTVAARAAGARKSPKRLAPPRPAGAPKRAAPLRPAATPKPVARKSPKRLAPPGGRMVKRGARGKSKRR